MVFDIQDVGARFYTYSCTMLYALEDAAQAKKPFYVLDRPNPITGIMSKGPRWTGSSIVHGLLRDAAAARADIRRTGDDGERRAEWGADLHVVQNAELAARRLVRFLTCDHLAWVRFAEHALSREALFVSGQAMLEIQHQVRYRLGREPVRHSSRLEQYRIDAQLLAQRLGPAAHPRRARLTVKFFQPQSSNFFFWHINSRSAFAVTDLSRSIACALARNWRLCCRIFSRGIRNFDKCSTLIGSAEIIKCLKAGTDASRCGPWPKKQ